MADPPISIVVEEPNDSWATWSHVFQGANTTWLPFDRRQIMGNFFNGLQGQTANSWDTQIPPNSKILAATMEFSPYQTRLITPFTATMNTPDRSGGLGVGNYALDPVQAPFQVNRQWRRDFWTNQTLGVLSTGFTALGGAATAPANGQWILNQLIIAGGTIGSHNKFGQLLTIRNNPPFELSFAVYEGFRTGNPPGDLRLRVQGVTFDRGAPIPDGVDLTVSTIAASSVPLGPAVGSIAFFFAAGNFVVPGQDYFFILECDYPPGVPNQYITVRHQNQFLTNGQLYHFGDGLGHDWQNYPGAVDVNQALTAPPYGSSDISWPIGGVVLGVTETSPDISQLLQDQIDAPGYTIDSGIVIGLTRVAPTSERKIMASNTHATLPGPILRVTYELGVDAIKTRTHDKFNDVTDQIYREDEDLIMIGQGAVDLFNRH
jgi:hypothetical protein